jgi:hypothetical protein
VDLEHEIARALAYGYIPNALNPDGELRWRDDWERNDPDRVDTPDRRYEARVIAQHLTRLGVTLPPTCDPKDAAASALRLLGVEVTPENIAKVTGLRREPEPDGPHLATRMVERTGLVLPCGDGEVFIHYETLEALTEVSVYDLVFGFEGPFVDPIAGQALVDAGFAARGARGGYYATDALKAFLQEA